MKRQFLPTSSEREAAPFSQFCHGTTREKTVLKVDNCGDKSLSYSAPPCFGTWESGSYSGI